MSILKLHKPIYKRYQSLVKQLGLGLITGAADDDPSGLATYSQAGAQFGAGMLWVLAFTTPLMIGIQMISARIGWMTGQGLAANIAKVMPRSITLILVGLLVLANTLNIAADLAAMGESLQLILSTDTKHGHHGYAALFGVLCAILPVWLNYEKMVSVLKWLTLTLLAYVAVVFMLHINWESVLISTLIPKLQANNNYWMMIVAVLGTTISPYLFFWQASQEAEARQANDLTQDLLNETVAQSERFMKEHLSRIKLDTVVGMLFSNVVAFCVMLATAITLHQHGITDIQTTKQAAEALRPIAGDFAFILFALGVIGTGMLAVPVLAGSAAYAVADVFEWRSGLDHALREAKGFYTVLICATTVGVLINFTAIDPIKTLIWSAVVNGVIAVPIMAVMLWVGTQSSILGQYTLSIPHKLLGGFATLVMFTAVLAMLYSWLCAV
jgi:NRAMP (natural resistance-associated macrophage protein)-like metal ion transporter